MKKMQYLVRSSSHQWHNDIMTKQHNRLYRLSEHRHKNMLSHPVMLPLHVNMSGCSHYKHNSILLMLLWRCVAVLN